MRRLAQLAAAAAVAASSCLATAAAAASPSVVCEGDWAKKVPCVTLASGNKLPQVAMGTWSGSYKQCPIMGYSCAQDSARFAVESWLRLGGTHIDSANNYRTQVAVMEALRSAVPQRRREEIYITTKCPGAIGYQATIQCADDNLQMLGQTHDGGYGYIDLLLVHFPFTMKPACNFNKTLPECADGKSIVPATAAQLQDTWRAMEELKSIGVVKSIGVSDFNIKQLQHVLDVAKEPIELNQVEWNPKHHDEELLKFCQDKGIQLQAWSPLGGAGGSVLGEDALKKAAASHRVSTAQVALRWSLQRGVVVVVGTADPAHAAGDIDIFGFELADDEMQSISALGGPKPPTIVA